MTLGKIVGGSGQMVLEWKDFEKEVPPPDTDLLFWLVDQKLMRVGRAYYSITDGAVVPIVSGYGQTNDKVYWTELPLPPTELGWNRSE